MNLFDLGRFHALVDYAHNPHSYEALAGFVRNWPGECIGVVGGPGDRRDEDFVTLGRLSAGMFDRVVVKEDDDNRGRPRGDAAKWIVEGLQQANPDCRFEVILDETTAIETALDTAPLNSLVVILPESVSRSIQLIEARNPAPTADTEAPTLPVTPVLTEPASPSEPVEVTAEVATETTELAPFTP
jgi:cyanophycin synthetase